LDHSVDMFVRGFSTLQMAAVAGRLATTRLREYVICFSADYAGVTNMSAHYNLFPWCEDISPPTLVYEI